MVPPSEETKRQNLALIRAADVGTHELIPAKSSSSLETLDLGPSTHVNFPEGSLPAWLTVAGGFAAVTATCGVINGIGLILAHLAQHQLKDFHPHDIGWIAATNLLLSLLIPGIAGPLFDRYGYRVLAIPGSVMYVLGLAWMSYLDTEDAGCSGQIFGCLVITWGVLCGSGSGMLCTAAVGATARWFSRRRGLACGIVFTGASIGAVLWSLVLRETLSRLGWQKSLHIVAGVTAVLLLASLLLTKPRPWIRGPSRGNTASLRGLGSLTFLLTAAGFTVFQFAVAGMYGTLPTWASRMAFDKSVAFNAIAIINAGGVFGRLLLGVAADRLGRFNVLIATLLGAIVLVFAGWLSVRNSEARLYVFAGAFGVGVSGIVSMLSVVVGQLCDVAEFGAHYGACSVATSIGGFMAIPLSAHILISVDSQWHICILGFLMVTSLCFFVAARATLRPRKLYL